MLVGLRKITVMAYSAKYMRCVNTILAHEGGFVDDPYDTGGATNYGISLRFLRALQGDLKTSPTEKDPLHTGDYDSDGDLDIEDVRHLTKAQAIEIYHKYFWLPYHYETLPEKVRAKVFDMAVNMGPRQSHKILQRSLRACGQDIAEDGILGPRTRGACQKENPDHLTIALRCEAAGFYRSLTAQKPNLNRYLKGWLQRAYT